MQIWTPAEQPHDNGEFAVRFNRGNGQPFAVITLSVQGNTELCMQSPGDCDRLIKAAAEARSLLLGETTAQDDAGRAIAADLDERRTPLPKTFTCASPRCDWHSGRDWNPAESCPICGSAVWPYAERGGTDAS